MKVCIDARWIEDKPSGIGVHTRQLIEGMRTVSAGGLELALLVQEGLSHQEKDTSLLGDWEVIPVPYGCFSPRGQLNLKPLLRTHGVNLFHSTNYMMPLAGGRAPRVVVTVHDLIPLLFRDHAPRSKKSRLFPVYRKLMREIGKRADAIITVSESSKQDVIEHLQARPNRVHAIYNGVHPRYQPGGDPSEAPFILYVGRRDPYKHLPELVNAFAVASERLPESLRLRVIGPSDARYPEAEEGAAAVGLASRVDWLGSVSNDVLLRSYQQASVLVLASDYEGFGLPVVEAMACETPVICANRSSLPEVGGEAAFYVEPGDVEGLARSLIQVLDPAADWSSRLQVGRDHAASFTVERMARETLALYRKVLQAGGSGE